MDCYICSTPMTEIRIDPRDNKPFPCTTCMEIISESLEDFEHDHVYSYDTEEPGFGKWGIPRFFGEDE